MSRRKTGTISFRLDSRLRSTLEEEASRRGVNLTTLALQILSRYISWGRYADSLKLLPVSKNLLREVFQALERKNIEEMGKRLGDASGRDMVPFLFQKINVQTVLDFIGLWVSQYDANEHRSDGRRHFFSLYHDVNLNYSHFISAYMSSMIDCTLAKPVQLEAISANSISFSFEG